MRRLGWALVLLLALTSSASAGIAIRESQGRLDLVVAAAPLSEVLDRLARQTGMKVVYEGPVPRQLVTLSIVGRSPAEAVTAILEGQGLNYALVLDATATRVEKLLVSGASARGPSSASPARPDPPSRARPRPLRPEFEPEPEPEPEIVAPSEEPPPPEIVIPPVPEKAPTAPNTPTSPVGMTPAPGTPPPGSPVPPTAPLYPSSPFNPVPLLPVPPAPEAAPEAPAPEAPPP